ncbi:MAG: DUF424 family protein, partial [Candidatus Bathyarchaeia archaeon]
MKCYTKIRKIGNHVLLAICDAEILGQTLREGKIVFRITEEFYKGEEMDIEEAIELIKNSTIVNMIGKN